MKEGEIMMVKRGCIAIKGWGKGGGIEVGERGGVRGTEERLKRTE